MMGGGYNSVKGVSKIKVLFITDNLNEQRQDKGILFSTVNHSKGWIRTRQFL